jgi:NADH-quinone oxidoreductase subunit E
VSLSEATIERIRELKQRYPSPRSAILPSLWAVQHEQGYITAEGMAAVAEQLEMAPAIVEATASFYSMYFQKPAGTHLVVICTNVSCALRGSARIVQAFEETLGIKAGETTRDGLITLQSTVECLGACGGAPALQVNHRFREDMTPEMVRQLVAELRAQPAKVAH